jgi:hypothetical protein
LSTLLIRAGGVYIYIIEKNEIGGACNTDGEERGVYRDFVVKLEEKRTLGTPRRRWEDNIRMDL